MQKIIFAFSLALLMNQAQAYIGPGLGAGTIGVILGVLGSIFLAIFAVAWYPLKRMLKKNKPEENKSEKDKQEAVTNKQENQPAKPAKQEQPPEHDEKTNG